ITVTAEAGFHETILTVSDTGIGMTPEQVKNIWERYYKADPSRKNTKYGESGLGLAIVHQLVQLHHGTIEVQSEPDQGTTFTLTFPDETVTTDAN
ncbi:sensor histidine kinase, partial [Acinetobacter ursingii]